MLDNVKEKMKDLPFFPSDTADGIEIQKRVLALGRGNQLNYLGYALAVALVAIGLNSNNIVLLIGGLMLGPLFGSIISLAYAFVEGDAKLVGSSLLYFIIQVVLGVIVSTAYFLFAGASKDASQMLYTTSPSFSLAFISFAAGIIAAIAITRKEKIHIFSGVAVATAMIPSVCTIGCGVAKGAFVYISGGIYMLFINGYFVCLGAAIIFFFVNREHVRVKSKKSAMNNIYLIVLAFVAMAPVGLLVYQTCTNGVTDYNIQRYVEEQYDFKNTKVVKTNVDKADKEIEILMVGARVSDKNITKAKQARKFYLLDDMNVRVIQSRESADATLPDSLKKDKIRQYGETLKVMYPEILSCSIGYVTNYEDDSKKIMVYLTTSEGLSSETISEIKDYLAVKTEVQPVKVLYDVKTSSSDSSGGDSSDSDSSSNSSEESGDSSEE